MNSFKFAFAAALRFGRCARPRPEPAGRVFARNHPNDQRRRRDPDRAHPRRRGSDDPSQSENPPYPCGSCPARRREARVLHRRRRPAGRGDELKAQEVHIFPEAMRGTGEGFRPFDLGPKSSMTNGNISARVDATTGPKLTVTYKGGEQTISSTRGRLSLASSPARRPISSPARPSSRGDPNRRTARSKRASSLSGRTGLFRRCDRLRPNAANARDLLE